MVRTLGIASALFAVACGGPDVNPAPVSGAVPTGVGPGPTAGRLEPSPTPGQLVRSGAISGTSAGGSQAVADAFVNAWVMETNRGFGYSYWYAHGPTRANSSGQFRLIGLPSSTSIQLQVWGDTFVQQCASRITMLSDMQLDVDLVSRNSLSASPDSLPPPAAGFRHISGTITQQIATGTQPGAGLFVDYEPVMDFPAAITFADATGRYLLCNIPDGEPVVVCAGTACVSVPSGQSTGVDITVPSEAG